MKENNLDHLPEGKTKPKKGSGIFILLGILTLAAVAAIVYLMVISSVETSELVKNISIVLLVFSSVIGTVSLVILIVQLAKLTNLVKNEAKPIMTTTRETVNHVKGTASFISDKMVTPVISTNAKIAGINRIVSILIPKKKKK
ncbi:MAG: hypothetical protein GX933_02780 [Chloroflexi bacterium]|nr:hypothetical protein [Chloroflexota bacterium]